MGGGDRATHHGDGDYGGESAHFLGNGREFPVDEFVPIAVGEEEGRREWRRKPSGVGVEFVAPSGRERDSPRRAWRGSSTVAVPTGYEDR